MTLHPNYKAMKTLTEKLLVNYVSAPTTEGGKPKVQRDVAILEVLSPTTARLELGPKSQAIAAYSEDKTTPNTFHFADDPEPAAAESAAAKTPTKG